MALASLTITYQDFRSRSISLWTVILVLCAAVSLSASAIGFKDTFQYWGMNVLFLSVQFGIVALYFGVKRKRWAFFDELIGWGDVLYLLAISALFSTVNFLLFYNISLVVTLIGFIFFRAISKNKDVTVPLAAGLAICSFIFIGTAAYFGYRPWDELPVYLLFE